MLTAFNENQDALHVQLSTKDWFILDANRVKKLTVDTWLRLDGPREFDLKPGETDRSSCMSPVRQKRRANWSAWCHFLYRTDTPSMVTPIISVSVYIEPRVPRKSAGRSETWWPRRGKIRFSWPSREIDRQCASSTYGHDRGRRYARKNLFTFPDAKEGRHTPGGRWRTSLHAPSGFQAGSGSLPIVGGSDVPRPGI